MTPYPKRLIEFDFVSVMSKSVTAGTPTIGLTLV